VFDACLDSMLDTHDQAYFRQTLNFGMAMSRAPNAHV
jgi:hypothetical protein